MYRKENRFIHTLLWIDMPFIYYFLTPLLWKLAFDTFHYLYQEEIATVLICFKEAITKRTAIRRALGSSGMQPARLGRGLCRNFDVKPFESWVYYSGLLSAQATKNPYHGPERISQTAKKTPHGIATDSIHQTAISMNVLTFVAFYPLHKHPKWFIWPNAPSHS